MGKSSAAKAEIIRRKNRKPAAQKQLFKPGEIVYTVGIGHAEPPGKEATFMKRILAWAGIAVIATAFIALAVFTASGASANAIIALLFCLLTVPVILYAFLLAIKLGRRGHDKTEAEANRADNFGTGDTKDHTHNADSEKP